MSSSDLNKDTGMKGFWKALIDAFFSSGTDVPSTPKPTQMAQPLKASDVKELKPEAPKYRTPANPGTGKWLRARALQQGLQKPIL